MSDIELTGMRKVIFEKAVELFAATSYDVVSMQDIGDAVGRKKSGLYNHFTSKQQILDTIYDFFCEYVNADRPSMETLEIIMKTGSIMDIINAFQYSYAPEYEKTLIEIFRLVHQRKYTDERARQIAKEILRDANIQFVEEVFDRAIEIGRIAPVDTHAISLFINNNRLNMYLDWVLDSSPENSARLYRELGTLNQCVASLITDLKVPAGSLEDK